MYFPLKVSIPEPCHEDWNNMTPVEFNQRHCMACDRVLTDFSNMTDVQIGSHLRRHEGKLCGRFRADQLDRSLRIGGPRKLRGLRAAAAAAGLLFTAPSLAQTPGPPAVEQRETVDLPPANTAPKTITIFGTVTAEGYPDEPLIGAAVYLKGMAIGTVTDIDGHYQLDVPAGASLTLMVSYTGFETFKKQFSGEDLAKAGDKLEAPLMLEEGHVYLTGIVVTCHAPPRQSLIDKIMVHPVKPIYPNDHIPTGPAKQGDWKDYWREKFAKAKARRIERRKERAERRASQSTAQAAAPAELPIANTPTPEVAGEKAGLGLSISPNPFTDFIRVSFELPTEQAYTLELVSIGGKLITTVKGKGKTGFQQIVMKDHLSNLPAGSYILRLKTEDGRFSKATLVR